MIQVTNPHAQYLKNKKTIDLLVKKVFQNKIYINGEQTKKLEKNFAKYIGTKDAIAVANGTDAIEIALRSLDIKEGDEIITTTHTAVATISAIKSSGGKPVLADISEETYNIDTTHLKKLLTKKTKAIVAVHIYGNSCNLEDIKWFCKKNNLYLIEDVSQAHGAKYKNKKLGSYGIISCFSCYPTKNLAAMGDAGLIATSSIRLAKKIRMLKEYGWKKRNFSEIHGRNSRMDEIQAGILNLKLKLLDYNNNKRKIIASIYNRELKNLDLITPTIEKHSEHVFHLYVIRTKLRNKLMKYLKRKKISTSIHYPTPVHLQKAYKELKKSRKMSVSEKISKEIISLPIFPEMTPKQALFICKCIKQFFK